MTAVRAAAKGESIPPEYSRGYTLAANAASMPLMPYYAHRAIRTIVLCRYGTEQGMDRFSSAGPSLSGLFLVNRSI